MALLASKVSAPNRATYVVAKQVLSVVRALPDVAYGLLFVAAVGTGALAGILALIFFNLGIAAKLTSETVDAIDPGPVEATDAVGAGIIERARVAIVPQVLPSYISYCLYVFELNIRASVIIGLVGGGGIGNVIRVELSRFNYGRLSALILALFVVVFALDALSRALRRRLV
jgi:phosphonate transport system permease protein